VLLLGLLFIVLWHSFFSFFTLIFFSEWCIKSYMHTFSLNLLYFCYIYYVPFYVLLNGVWRSINKRITYLLTYNRRISRCVPAILCANWPFACRRSKPHRQHEKVRAHHARPAAATLASSPPTCVGLIQDRRAGVKALHDLMPVYVEEDRQLVLCHWMPTTTCSEPTHVLAIAHSLLLDFQYETIHTNPADRVGQTLGQFRRALKMHLFLVTAAASSDGVFRALCINWLAYLLTDSVLYLRRRFNIHQLYSHTNLTCIPWRCTGWAKMNFLRQGFPKLSSDKHIDRQTHRHAASRVVRKSPAALRHHNKRHFVQIRSTECCTEQNNRTDESINVCASSAANTDRLSCRIHCLVGRHRKWKPSARKHTRGDRKLADEMPPSAKTNVDEMYSTKFMVCVEHHSAVAV